MSVSQAVKFASQQIDWAPMIEPNGIRGFERPLDEISDPKLKGLFDHWDSARCGMPLLRRADLRPEAFAAALPHVAIIEQRRNQDPGLHIRLAGEEVVNRTFGFVKNRFVEDLSPAWYRDHLVSNYRRVFREGRARLELVRVVHSYRVILYHRLTLPMTLFGHTVDQLLVASIRTRQLADFIAVGKELSP